MSNSGDFKKTILETLVSDLKGNKSTVAAWEGGSAANETSDHYSDIDLVVVDSDSIDLVFDSVESSLDKVSEISHKLIVSLRWGCVTDPT